MNCCVSPLATEGAAGVMAIDCNVGAVTVSTSAGLVTPLREAVMFVVPAATAVAKPPEAMVAVPGVPEFHVTEEVISTMLESLYVPLAVNCCVVPLMIEGAAGVTAIDCRVGAATVAGALPPQPMTQANRKLSKKITTIRTLVFMTHSIRESDFECFIVRNQREDERETFFFCMKNYL